MSALSFHLRLPPGVGVSISRAERWHGFLVRPIVPCHYECPINHGQGRSRLNPQTVARSTASYARRLPRYGEGWGANHLASGSWDWSAHEEEWVLGIPFG